jgi:hypothetical protein
MLVSDQNWFGVIITARTGVLNAAEFVFRQAEWTKKLARKQAIRGMPD